METTLPTYRAMAASCAVLLVATITLGGCSKQKRTVSEIRGTYEKAEYGETVGLCRYAIRRGMDNADVYFYYGASLMHMGRDYEGFKQLSDAVSRDSLLVSKVSTMLADMGEKDVRAGKRSRGVLRLQRALEFDGNIDLRGYKFAVADQYFESTTYDEAAPLYRAGIAEFPDTSACQAALFNLSHCQAELGENINAIETLQELLTRYPRGRFKSESKFRLANLQYEAAEKQYVLGNYEDVLTIVEELLEVSDSRGMRQKSRFLLGETCEAMNDFDAAYVQYRAIIAEDRGASGRIVERARGKIKALQEAGLN